MKVFEIAGLLFLASSLIAVLSGLVTLIEDMEGVKSKTKIVFIISLIILMLSFIIMIIYSIKNLQPTFREVCEANNGIYIENHGHAGNSCIYSKGSEE